MNLFLFLVQKQGKRTTGVNIRDHTHGPSKRTRKTKTFQEKPKEGRSFRAYSNTIKRKVGSAGDNAHPEAKSHATKRYTCEQMLEKEREAKPGRASKKRPRAPSWYDTSSRTQLHAQQQRQQQQRQQHEKPVSVRAGIRGSELASPTPSRNHP